MRRIGLAVVLALGLFAAPLVAEGQRGTKIQRIGFLASESRATFEVDRIQVFRQALRDFGYVEGQNIGVEWRFTDGKDERAADLATELVHVGVDVLVVSSVAPALAAKQATKTIPIVFLNIGNPVARGLVASIPRPGGNVTGVGTFSGPETNSKRLELLVETIPGILRVAVLRYKSPAFEELPRSSVDVLQDAARTLGVKLQLLHVQAPDDLERAFAAITRERAQAIFEVPSQFFRADRARLLALVAKSRLPASYGDRSFVEQGGLMSYGESPAEVLRLAATYVDRILKGAKPADLPVQQSTKFEFVINIKTANALGLTIPSSVLGRADQVIE